VDTVIHRCVPRIASALAVEFLYVSSTPFHPCVTHVLTTASLSQIVWRTSTSVTWISTVSLARCRCRTCSTTRGGETMQMTTMMKLRRLASANDDFAALLHSTARHIVAPGLSRAKVYPNPSYFIRSIFSLSVCYSILFVCLIPLYSWASLLSCVIVHFTASFPSRRCQPPAPELSPSFHSFTSPCLALRRPIAISSSPSLPMHLSLQQTDLFAPCLLDLISSSFLLSLHSLEL